MKISVVVCTYNRSNLLDIALSTLCQQMLDKSLWELIVIDNNSSDNTRWVADHYCSTYPNVRYFIEKEQGLSHARNRGWKEALGKYVGYCDDDCKLPEQWLSQAAGIIDSLNPDIFGGSSKAFYLTPKPEWYRDSYVAWDRGPTPRRLQGREYLVGNNIFFKRELLESVGGFDTSLGMSGNRLGYNEEIEIVYRAQEQCSDLMVYYDPNLAVYHLARPEQMTLKWCVINAFVLGLYARHLEPPQRTWDRVFLLPFKFCYLGGRLIFRLVGAFLFRDKTAYPYVENDICERALPVVMHIGAVSEEVLVLLGRW